MSLENLKLAAGNPWFSWTFSSHGLQRPSVTSLKFCAVFPTFAAYASMVRIERQQPGLAAWYLANEEPRFWRANAIKTHDPGQRPIVLYEPNYRISGDLEKTSGFVFTGLRKRLSDFVASGSPTITEVPQELHYLAVRVK